MSDGDTQRQGIPGPSRAVGLVATRSLKVRRKPTQRAPLVRLTWPAQPVLGSLDFDDTEGA